jgi:hypothetical protein
MRLPVALAECHEADRRCLHRVPVVIGGEACCVSERLLRWGSTMVKRHDAQVLLNDSTTRSKQDGEGTTPRDILPR